MSNERYVGERRALWHFLSELQPLVAASLGDDALLSHRLARALKAGDLENLRNARRIFHNQPDDLKRKMMRGIFEGTATGAEIPSPLSDEPVARDGTVKPDMATIRFDAFPAAHGEDVTLSVELDQDHPSDVPVRVMIKAGTLPSTGAETLRQIADWIEHDRRMLSTQHWARDDKHGGQTDETVDQA